MQLLSIIIPIYNSADWLDQCITSILDIIKKSAEVELILVNDGSTDSSKAICEKYVSQHSNIRLINKTNGGVASARNAGLAAARGQYIAWVDPDDYVSPNWFTAVHSAIQSNAPDIIVMDTIRFCTTSETPEIYGRPGGFVDRDIFMEDLIRDIRMLSGLPNKVMKAELFSGVTFDTTLPILEDFAAMPQILSNAKTVYYIPQFLYFYRQHETSLLHHITTERGVLSIQIALDRAACVAPKFRKAAVTAACNQMLTFCSNQYCASEAQPSENQIRFCKQYIRQNLTTLLFDPELTAMNKIKHLLLAFGFHMQKPKNANRNNK